jgi:predicted DNA-binding transcriptional regulator AlpA
MATTHDNTLISQRDAADLLGLSERTLEAMRLRKTGPAFVRISRRCVRYRHADLERFIESRTVATNCELAAT